MTAALAASLDELLAGSRYVQYLYAYPHKTAYRRIEPPIDLAALWAAERRDALFVYLHVPFCEQRCGFCNLFTRPVPPAETVTAYLDALARQVAVVQGALARGGAYAFARAAIGGGTPTLLDAAQLARAIELLRALGAPRGIPMSVETSPETALPDRLAVLVGEGGADRISMGIQSFVERECKAVNRPQLTADVHRAIRAIRDSGVATLNLDLMYGLPEQTEATFAHSLAEALAYAPEELYLYPLYVRPLTTLGRKQAHAADAHRVALYEQARATLAARGYAQVSMRMFRRATAPAAPAPTRPYACQDDGMVGLGCGARSYTRGVHYSSEWAVGARGVREIIDHYLARPDADFAVADYGFVLDDAEQRRRYAILSLLADTGLDLAAYRARFAGADARADFPELDVLAARALATITETTVALTAEGLAHADLIGPWLSSPEVARRMRDYELR